MHFNNDKYMMSCEEGSK